MKYPIFLNRSQITSLDYEVLSQDFLIRVTRILLHWSESGEYENATISRKNTIINLSRTISGGKIYKLSSDDDGFFHPAEHFWHDSTFLLVIRNLSTIEFIELICELIKKQILTAKEINDILELENASFRFKSEPIGIEVYPISDLEGEEQDDKSHPNIRLLIDRMEKAYSNDDYTLVLHTSSNIFETMAKDIIGIATIQDQTLKSFFDRYRNDSSLKPEILDYILSVYESRGSEPLAGHGSTQQPTITKEEAITLKEMTKAFVKIEYELNAET